MLQMLEKVSAKAIYHRPWADSPTGILNTGTNVDLAPKVFCGNFARSAHKFNLYHIYGDTTFEIKGPMS